MSRIPPHNLRLTSGTLKFEVSGTSNYYLQTQLKQQFSLRHSIEITRQALQWRLLQNRTGVVQNVRYELLPLITRIRCRWDIKGQLVQNQAFYHSKLFYLAPILFGREQKNATGLCRPAKAGRKSVAFQPAKPGPYTSKFPNKDLNLKCKQAEAMLESKTYKNTFELHNFEKVPLEPKGHPYNSALRYALKFNWARQITRKALLQTQNIRFRGAYQAWLYLFWQSYSTVSQILQHHTYQKFFKNVGFFSYRNHSSVAFSLFCIMCLIQNIAKVSQIYKGGLKLTEVTKPRYGSNVTSGYNHASKVSLGYASDSRHQTRGSISHKSKAVNLTLTPKDQTYKLHSPIESTLSYGFHSKATLNLFSFETYHASKTKAQKVVLNRVPFGAHAHSHRFKTSSLKIQPWAAKICKPCFDYSYTTRAYKGSLFYEGGLNSYVSFQFNLQNINVEAIKLASVSNLSLRL